MHKYRTHSCNELRIEDSGDQARLSGWIHRKRDHGNLLFIDLRDHFGITQCVLDVSNPMFEQIEAMRLESVICVTGKIVARSDDTINLNLPTGKVELAIEEVDLLGAADPLPLQVNSDEDYGEEIRLKYRFLDLRRERVHRNITLRSSVISSIRRRMTDQGFIEFQTPILTSTSPEGARDFLVPSRVHPGHFYALPQAPQQFKQLIMVAGFDRYFQIAPCFRDEDARADRSPGEFYQLDVEMSFVTQEDVFDALEPVLHGVFEEFSDGKKVSSLPFPRIPYDVSMLKYGNDKPDLRNPIIMTDVTDVWRGTDFKIFAAAIEKGSVVRAIPAPGAAAKPRSFFDKLNDWARAEGAGGLGYIIFEDGKGKGPIAKFLDEDRTARLLAETGAGDGDAIFFACGPEAEAARFSGQARDRIGEELGLIDEDRFEFCWIVDYPMYERDERTGKLEFSHNPFSMPQGGLEALETMDPLDIKAYQYDIVCNGTELSSGAIRNHLPNIMYKAFGIAGYDRTEVETRFGGMLNAFKFGAPPHGGSAPGIDRIVMLLAGEQNIREVTMFPMTQQAQDLMMAAPAPVEAARMEELHIRVVMPPTKES
jgi:aspartyl-tRNA synthetase